jgi:V/A-type H+-transporting ATPase subunit A
MIGTVSPAGGNFEEPVTQSTLSTVKAFLGLSADRAYKRFYPAVDPLLSWSRYLEQLQPWYERELAPNWIEQVREVVELLARGNSVYEMIQVAGEEGVTLEDYIVYHQSLFVDMVYLQQDAFDKVDVTVPLERQKETFLLIMKLLSTQHPFSDQSRIRDYFTRLTGLFKNMNYAVWKSNEYQQLLDKIAHLKPGI